MSEKAVLTNKEIGALESAIANEKGDKAQVLRFQGMTNCSWRNECSPLNEMSFEKVARALFIGYEVEKPKFKVGDKITWDGLGEVLEISNIFDVSGTPFCNFENMAGSCSLARVRHATPEEIYWLHELGRDKVLDIEIGDYILFDSGDTLYIHDENTMSAAINLYSEEIKGIYPAESFKPFPK